MPAPQSRRAHRARAHRARIAGLLVLAPVCAEYLSAYDDSTGDVVRLIGGLIVFSPLYGAPALLIREVGRRAGLGWPTIVLLAAVFGLTEAGLVDQSLFSLDYRHIESWDEGLRATFLAPLGLSAYNVLNFIGGHVIYSICVPIALVEAFGPDQREPWLSRRALIGVAGLYVAASALVLGDHLATEDSHASAGQLAGTGVVIAVLVLAALTRSHRGLLDRPAPRARTVLALALAVALVYHLAGTSWAGFAVGASALVLGGAFLARAARSRTWGLQHVVAVAVAFVLVRAVLAFTYFPVIGDVSAVRKYGHNAVLFVAVLAISLLAARAASSPGREAPARAADAPAAVDDR